MFNYILLLLLLLYYYLTRFRAIETKCEDKSFNHILFMICIYLFILFVYIISINCILVITHPDDSNRTDRKMLVKNKNM